MSHTTGEDELEELDEDSLHNSEALPTRRPHPIVIAASLTARGGLLWLPVPGLLALCGKRTTAQHTLTAAVPAMPLGHLVSEAVHRRRPRTENVPARRALPDTPTRRSRPGTR